MKEELKEKLAKMAMDCFERGEECDIAEDIEGRNAYFEESRKLAETLKDIEESEARVNDLKEKSENDWKKFGITTAVGAATAFTMKAIDWLILRKQTRDICYFEKNNTFTTQAGKGLNKIFNSYWNIFTK